MTSAQDPQRVSAASRLTEQVHLLTRTMQVLRNQLAGSHVDDIPWPTYMLLFHLVAGGPRRAGALADLACVDASTVSRQVDTLVRRGLVERQADPDDGRATVLVPTAEGLAVQERVRAGRDRVMAEVLRDWSEEDVARLTTLLGRFTADMTGHLPELLAAMPRHLQDDETRASA